MKTKFLSLVTLFSILLFVGCSTNEPVNLPSTSNTILTDDVIINSEIDASLDDVTSIAEDQFSVQQSLSSKTSGPVKSMLPPCATITTALTNDIFTKTIDFGTAGCTLPNGNIVKGKIIIRFSKNFMTPSKTISYTLEGFYHNSKLIEGNKTITHELKSTKLLAALHPVTTHSIDMKITFSDGKVYSRIGTRVREMVEGFETIGNWEDNVFKVWGSHTTAFPNGSIYTSTIKTPLVIKMSCKRPFPVSGIVDILKNDATATLDYGNGDCDNQATMTINGVSKEIVLRK
jgi:hypothetical protein